LNTNGCPVGIGIGLGTAAGVWLFVRPAAVSRHLAEQVERGPGTVIDFAEIARFPWDRVHIFGPYTPHRVIEDRLGFPWPKVRQTTIEHSDRVNLVVFVRGRAVTCWFEHPRGRGELEPLVRPAGYSRPEARFRVVRHGPEQRPTLQPL
jgi:hypothetical protein